MSQNQKNSLVIKGFVCKMDASIIQTEKKTFVSGFTEFVFPLKLVLWFLATMGFMFITCQNIVINGNADPSIWNRFQAFSLTLIVIGISVILFHRLKEKFIRRIEKALELEKM
ncbi:MAG: glucan phosphoethanolaminetransferase (alkaline phosphatase superfamily) [Bacteroidia bacterium]